MLVGPGGVVALVVGAWSVMWAVRRVPGRSGWVIYPAIAAFVAVILGFAMLTAQSEVMLGLVQWHRSDAEERPAVVAETLSVTWRPLFAAAISVTALAVAVVLSRQQPARVDEQRPHLAERVAVAVMVGLALVDFGVWIAMRRAFVRLTDGGEMLLVAVPRGQLLTLIGATTSLLLIGVAVGVGVWRVWRR
jgi:hypothetical protein